MASHAPTLCLRPRSGGWMTAVRALSSGVKGKVDIESQANIQSRDCGQIWSMDVSRVHSVCFKHELVIN